MRWTGADPEPDDSARKPARGRVLAVACAWTAATVAATFLGWLAVGSVLLPTDAPSQDPSTGSQASAPAPPSASPSDTSSADANIQRYSTGGGIVVLDVEAHTVSLVSAVPASGYTMEDWVEDGWLRVDFTGSATVYTVLATWNGTSPQVQSFSDPAG